MGGEGRQVEGRGMREERGEGRWRRAGGGIGGEETGWEGKRREGRVGNRIGGEDRVERGGRGGKGGRVKVQTSSNTG